MSENLKTIIVFIICICCVVMTCAVAISLCERGVAEIRVTVKETASVASCSARVGFSVWGYRVELLQEMK